MKFDRPKCPYCQDGGYMMQAQNTNGRAAYFPCKYRCNVCGAMSPRAKSMGQAVQLAHHMYPIESVNKLIYEINEMAHDGGTLSQEECCRHLLDIAKEVGLLDEQVDDKAD